MEPTGLVFAYPEIHGMRDVRGLVKFIMIHIGTSGWSYKHWKPLFYPDKLPMKDWLSFYAGQFGVTEINSSFYRLPKPETVQKWVSAVPPGFLFCPKISQYITHAKKLKDPEDTLTRFFDVFAPFRNNLGPILLQLPASVAFHEQKVAHFFEILRDRYKSFTYALEIRHESWLQPAAIGLLKKHRIALVMAESGERWPYAEIVTDKNIYIRFHGPDGSYSSSYNHEILKVFANKCLAWQKAGHRIWVFFNNDIHGYAIDNAKTFTRLTS